MQNFFEAPTLPDPRMEVRVPDSSVPAPTPQRPGDYRARRAIPVVVAVVAVLAAVVAVSWVLATTVPSSDYDEVNARLDRRTAQLADAEDQIGTLQSTTDELDTEIAALTTQNDDLTADVGTLRSDLAAAEVVRADAQQRLDRATLAAAAIAYIALDWWPDDVDTVTAAGAVSSPDELLAALGEDATWSEWVNANDVWRERDRAIAALDDEPLIEAWDRYWEAELGSPEEGAAWADFQARLTLLLVESLQD